MQHESYMLRALDLARRSTTTLPNPQVGAVIVYQNRIIGEGFHAYPGGPHAEVEALNSVSDKDKVYLPDSIIYVTLEPCNHHGKTPPCTMAIIRSGIPTVVIGTEDPNTEVLGGGIQALTEAGLKVTVGVCSAECRELLRPFVHCSRHKKPYTILKYAVSADGYLAPETGKYWLTCRSSKILVHRWRSELQAIMVGTNTVIEDDPRLTQRLYYGPSPIRIILDRRHRLDGTHKVFQGDAQTWVIGTESEYAHPCEKYIQISDGDWSLSTLLSRLYDEGIYTLLVEGGAQLLRSFYHDGLWNEARIFHSPVELKSGLMAPLPEGKSVQWERHVDSDTLRTTIQTTES